MPTPQSIRYSIYLASQTKDDFKEVQNFVKASCDLLFIDNCSEDYKSVLLVVKNDDILILHANELAEMKYSTNIKPDDGVHLGWLMFPDERTAEDYIEQNRVNYFKGKTKEIS